ncbi:MAG: helix-turn-helix domain-containing protein [Verrucomicrobia bacterium]|nr:helix-turn-helix domain-containing protein [Verrucomicrobiota bacterium]
MIEPYRVTNEPTGFRYLRVEPATLRQELYVTSVGKFDHAAGQPYPHPGHPDGYAFDWKRGRVLGDFAVVYLSRGAGTFETKTSRTRCRQGDALIIPPGLWHRYRPDPATGWCEHWVCANGEYLHRLRAKGMLFTAAAVTSGTGLREWHRLLWTQARRPKARNDLTLAACALGFFSQAARPPSDHPPTRRPWTQSAGSLVEAAREYIYFNSHRPLTVELIARHVGTSRRTLERQYAQTGAGQIARDLATRRVERARQLLTETGMSVKEIAYAVGFGDSRRLIRNFSAQTGTTPAAFRSAKT